MRRPAPTRFCGSSDHSFVENFPAATLFAPILTFDRTGALAIGDFSEGDDQQVIFVFPTQDGQILELEAASFLLSHLLGQGCSPLREVIGATGELRRVEGQDAIDIATGSGHAPSFYQVMNVAAVLFCATRLYPLQRSCDHHRGGARLNTVKNRAQFRVCQGDAPVRAIWAAGIAVAGNAMEPDAASGSALTA